MLAGDRGLRFRSNDLAILLTAARCRLGCGASLHDGMRRSRSGQRSGRDYPVDRSYVLFTPRHRPFARRFRAVIEPN